MLTKKFRKYFLLLIFLQCGSACIGQNGYGQAIFKQDFGFGNNNPATIGTPLPANKTFFTFEPSVCPAPGNYSIIRRVPVANCFTNEWIGLSHDNNPLIDFGMMMAVNNITNANNRLVYMDTVYKPLCVGAVYGYTAAIINLDLIDGPLLCPHGPDYPVFEFRIEDQSGNLIKKDTTPGIVSYAAPPLMGYRFGEYGFSFTMPAGVTKLVLKLTLLHSTYLCAEDFAIDDIQVRPLGPDVKIKYDNEPPTTFVKSICFQDNKTVQLSGIMDPYYPTPSLQWQQSTDNGVTWVDIPGATSNIYSRVFSVADTFLFRLSGGDVSNIANPNCRVVSNVLKVEVDGLPSNYTITNNSPVCAGQDLKFNASGAASYIWTGPNGFYDIIPFPHIFFSTLADSGTYYVEIFSLGGCRKTDSTHVTIIGTDVHAGPDTSVCKGEPVLLRASAGVSYQWSPAAGLSNTSSITTIAKPDVNTVYTVKVTDQYGCSDTAMVHINLLNAVTVKAVIEAADYVCRAYDSLFFYNKSLGAIKNWDWNFGNGQTSTLADPAVQYFSIPANQTSFVARLAVKDTAGCTDTSYHIIKVAENCYIAVPSAFTPNNDGKNDYLYPLNAYKATNLVFRVYNRMGRIVFETRDWTKKWDGRINGMEQPVAVYIWMLDYNDAGGRRVSLKGTTALIR
jgi:gliding motility-associated-like protein